MAFKLVIGDVLDVAVKGSVKDGAATVPFSFTLQMKRLPVEQYREAIKPENDMLVREFLVDNVQGWRGQRLVLDDDEQPAGYSPEAFACLLTLVGMEQTCVTAYLQALQVSDTAAGRRGN